MKYYSEETVKKIMQEVEVKETQCNIYDNLYSVHRIYPNLDNFKSIELAEPHSTQGNWHTGEPTEEGWYLIQTEDGDFMAVEKNEHGLWFVDSFGCSKVNLESIVAWQKIEPNKED